MPALRCCGLSSTPAKAHKNAPEEEERVTKVILGRKCDLECDLWHSACAQRIWPHGEEHERDGVG